MRMVFMGSAEVSCTILQALTHARAFTLAGVVTQPDRPCGRHQHLMPCACKTTAQEQRLPIICPEKLNRAEVLHQLALWAPEVIVVVAYGQFLGPRILALPPLGCINIHLSLLPRHRGAAPIHRAIAAGDHETGVTAMLMDAGMDSGDILMQATEPILPDDTAGTLHDRLALLGGSLLLRCLHELQAGRLVPQPQDPNRVTFAPKLHKDEGLLDWRLPAATLALRVRAFHPWPGCHTWIAARGRQPAGLARLKVLVAAAETGLPAAAPGTVLDVEGPGPAIATGTAALRLLSVQPEGARPMDGRAFLRGHGLRRGDCLPAPPAAPSAISA